MFWLEDGGKIPAEWFDDDGVDADAWYSDVVHQYFYKGDLERKLEVLPFSFAGHRYLMYFESIACGLPGLSKEELAEHFGGWSGHYLPAIPEVRLVKFMRMDSPREKIYEPEAWKLGKAQLIYQFGEFLIDLLAHYTQQHPEIVQIFYRPASGLARFYDRTCKTHSQKIANLGFAMINHKGLEESGYVGFEKQP